MFVFTNIICEWRKKACSPTSGWSTFFSLPIVSINAWMVKQYNDKQPFTFFEVQKSRVVKWVSPRPFFHIYLSICCLHTKSSHVHQERRRSPLRTRPITAMGTIVVPYKKISYNKNLLQGLFQNIIFFFANLAGKQDSLILIGILVLRF